jgi:hypothetical protein
LVSSQALEPDAKPESRSYHNFRQFSDGSPNSLWQHYTMNRVVRHWSDKWGGRKVRAKKKKKKLIE